MTDLDAALRWTEVLLALAMALQSAEHLAGPQRARWIFAPRLGLCLLLLAGVQTPLVLAALVLLAVAALHRFDGPYNGGSDRMTVLILLCLTAARFAPTVALAELALGYLAVQLVLSYFFSGWVKIRNPEWRSGRALGDVFAFSAYPVSEALRRHADRPALLFAASWAVMLFELAFPLALLDRSALWLALCAAAAFHLANACLFGLNRFFWIWLCAYPSLLWLQARLVG